MCDVENDTKDWLLLPRELVSELLALPAEALKVYIYLRSLDRGQEFAASIPMIVDVTGRASRSVRTDLNTLREKKLIIRQPGKGNQPNMYSFPESEHKARQMVDPLQVSVSEFEVMPAARECEPPAPLAVGRPNVRAEDSHPGQKALDSGGEDGFQAACVGPQPTTSDLETKIRELIAACYRRITDQEYAELRNIYPDESRLISTLHWAEQRRFGVEAHMNLGFFILALDSVS